MARFMREHAYDLIRALGLQDEAGIDEDVFTFGGQRALRRKGVKGRVAVDVELHGRRIDAGGFQERLLIAVERPFDLGVADDADALRRGGARRCEKGNDGRK